MLKLKKNRGDNKITVVIPDKDFFITRPFVVALTIALAVHFLLAIIFHIVPFTISFNQQVFPPVNVEANPTLKDSVVAEMKMADFHIRGLPEIPASVPLMDSHPQYLDIRPAETMITKSLDKKKFTEIEKEIYHPIFQPSHHIKEPLKIVISGLLGDAAVVKNGLRNNEQIPPVDNDSRVIFKVLVEAISGNVFWFEPIELAQERQANLFAETILRGMKFNLDENAIAVSGEIEFHFNQVDE